MKNKLKYILIGCFIAIISLEGYFILKQDNKIVDNKEEVKVDEKEESTNKKPVVLVNEEDKKYVGNIYDYYYENGLNFTYQDNSYGKVLKISGLKNKKIENKINDFIYNKTKEISNKLKANVSSSVSFNNSNILGITFFKINLYDFSDDIEYYVINLNDGEKLELSDLFYDLTIVRDELSKETYKQLTKIIGFVKPTSYNLTEGFENPIPDYSSVEDSLLQIISKFNNGDYDFIISNKYLTLFFNDLNLVSPIILNEMEDDVSKCIEYNHEEKLDKCYKCKRYSDSEYYVYIDYSVYQKEISIRIDLYKLYKSITAYDKYLTEESLFENSNNKLNLRFYESDNENQSMPIEKAEFIEEENKFIDYTGYFIENEAKLKLISDINKWQTNDYNLYNVFGYKLFGYSVDLIDLNYIYVNYDVKHYNLKKDVFLKSKDKIYYDKFLKEKFSENPEWNKVYTGINYKFEYEYYKEYNDKNETFLYAFDKSGNEINLLDTLNINYLKEIIPSNWYANSSFDKLVKNLYLDEFNLHDFGDRLVIDISDSYIYQVENTYPNITLKYKGNTKNMCNDYTTCNEIMKKLFK